MNSVRDLRALRVKCRRGTSGYKPNERAAVMRHGVALLVVQGQAPYPQLAEWFVQTLPCIEAFVTAHAPPYIAKVQRPTPKELTGNPKAPGRVVLWVPGGT